MVAALSGDSTSARWEAYFRWNSAVADVLFGPSAAGVPAYLDLEGEVLEEIAGKAEPGCEDPKKALAAAVKATLLLEGTGKGAFSEHIAELNHWGNGTDPPPTLALLAVLSLAAEDMRSGDGMSANNYYGRLRALLEIEKDQLDRLVSHYRKDVLMQHALSKRPVSSILWGSLNNWLERLDGERGLPTAVAISHPHIGLPLSQALVRATDRARFAVMFASFGLPPHYSLGQSDMERLIHEWISRNPCPASNTLERLWKRAKAARERIADVACVELEAWDGTGSGEQPGAASASATSTVSLFGLVSNFPERRLELSLLVMGDATAGGSVDYEVLGEASGAEPAGVVEFLAAGGGRYRLGDPTLIDAASMVSGLTQLRKVGGSTVARRRPRRLVPLRRDDFLQAFVESPRAQLGEDTILLAQDVIAGQVEEALISIARPGFSRSGPEVAGVPEGWALFTDVQIMSPPTEVALKGFEDLYALVPLSTSQIVISGGLQFPGRIRKWSSLHPPEIRASLGASANARVELECIRPLVAVEPETIIVTSDAPVIVVQLGDRGLVDGDYEVRLFRDSEKAPVSQVGLRLGSADSRMPRFGQTVHLEHAMDGHDPLGPLSAMPERSSDPAVVGARLVGDMPASGPLPAVPSPSWFGRPRSATPTTIAPALVHIGPPDPTSCVVTGQHVIVLPKDTGKRSGGQIVGICRHCGLTKRYPARYTPTYGAKKAPVAITTTAPRFDVTRVAPITTDIERHWDALLDGLGHVGGGGISELERMALQVEPSMLFVDQLVRTLEALGHLEVERDPSTLLPIQWEVAPPVLAETSNGEYVLCGLRSQDLVASLRAAAQDLGAQIDERPGLEDGPTVVMLKGIDAAQASTIAAQVSDAVEVELIVAAEAARGVASVLPPLSALLAALPETSMVGARTCRRWDAETAHWHECTDAEVPGFFQLRSHSTIYCIRRREHIVDGKMLRADARLVKYAAAIETGFGLVGYDEATHSLYVPLGADLPGLYARAAVLASGVPPQIDTHQRLIHYRDVPDDVARMIAAALST